MSDIIKDPGILKTVPQLRCLILRQGNGTVRFGWNFLRNSPFWYCYFNRTPGAVLHFGERAVRPDARHLLLIPPHTPFRTTLESPFEHLYIHFTVDALWGDVRPEPLLLDAAPFLPFIERIESEKQNNIAVPYAIVCGALALLPQECFRREGERGDQRITQALALLEKGENNGAIAAAIGMSESNFQRKFKKEMAISPKQYSLLRRLEKGRCELENGSKSIDEIAAECGFADRFAFSKAFKLHSGFSPGSCRRQNDGGKSRGGDESQ